MPPIQTGSRVKYTPEFLAGLPYAEKYSHTGVAQKVVATKPPLVFVRWDDGSYHAASEKHLETD